VLATERRGSTLLLTVDRPASRNAINRALAQDLVQALEGAGEDATLHAVVLASSDPAVFLSGGDIDELSRLPYDETGAQGVLDLGVAVGAIEACPVPVIAAVEGAVFGGGCELLVMCDLVVMAEKAQLRFVHARMGLVPAWGGATRLIERVGAARAADVLLTARPVEAKEAARIGIASRVVATGRALPEALALAGELSKHPRASLTAVKRSLVAAKTARRGEAFEREREIFREVWGSDAHRAAFSAFLGKKSLTKKNR
jgi:enoyl-CoA hydratase